MLFRFSPWWVLEGCPPQIQVEHLQVVVHPQTVIQGGASNSLSNPLTALELKNGLNMVQSLVYGKKYEKAEIKLISLEVKFPQNADIQNYLGFVSRKMNKLGKSDAYYKKALQLNPMHKGALEYQGELFLQYENLEKANANLKLLERICGVNCDEYKDLKKAIENFK